MFIILQIPKQYQNLNRQSKEKYDEHHAKLIEELIACDDFEDIATLKVIKMSTSIISNFQCLKCFTMEWYLIYYLL